MPILFFSGSQHHSIRALDAVDGDQGDVLKSTGPRVRAINLFAKNGL